MWCVCGARGVDYVKIAERKDLRVDAEAVQQSTFGSDCDSISRLIKVDWRNMVNVKTIQNVNDFANGAWQATG